MKRKLVYLSDEEIINLIVEKFDGAHCFTCAHKTDDSYCDWCEKHNSKWAVSREYAEIIADKILKF